MAPPQPGLLFAFHVRHGASQFGRSPPLGANGKPQSRCSSVSICHSCPQTVSFSGGCSCLRRRFFCLSNLYPMSQRSPLESREESSASPKSSLHYPVGCWSLRWHNLQCQPHVYPVCRSGRPIHTHLKYLFIMYVDWFIKWCLIKTLFLLTTNQPVFEGGGTNPGSDENVMS